MPTRSYSFYDTATLANAANTVHEMFQVRQGGTTNATKFVTNMRGNGEFQSSETFELKGIKAFPNSVLALADMQSLLFASYVEIQYQDNIVFQCTLRECIALNHWGGHYSQAAAADGGAIGIQNDGYMLENPLTIQGGNSFRVLIGQGTALTTADDTLVVSLTGLYTTP